MNVGIHFMNFTLAGEPQSLAPVLSETAKVADQADVEWFTAMDHWFQMEMAGRSEDPMLEGYTTLGYVAAITERVKLGLLVTGVTYRHPGLLAKIVTTLDVLSGGRAMLGIGAAWYEREHRALGVPYPPTAERFERLEESLQIALQMWGNDDGPFEGKHYHLAETINYPRAIQRPHPTILIGGGGEQKTLKFVARYGDACNLFDLGAEEVQRKLDVLARHCETEQRDFATIRKTLVAGIDPLADTDAFLKHVEPYARLGISLVNFAPRGDDPVRFTTELGERVLPRLAELG
jgi:F420-dependent oxidoreductase-like protein